MTTTKPSPPAVLQEIRESAAAIQAQRPSLRHSEAHLVAKRRAIAKRGRAAVLAAYGIKDIEP